MLLGVIHAHPKGQNPSVFKNFGTSDSHDMANSNQILQVN